MRRIALETVGSTNAEARRLIDAGAVDGWTLVTARQQMAGRGREARVWTSPPGNFYGSFIVPRGAEAEWKRPWLCGFAVALAIAQTAEEAIDDGAPVRIKWPNDVLVAGAKLSGVLIEASGNAPFLVVGTGVNLASHPPDTPYPATHLDAHRQSPIDVDAFAEKLGVNLRRAVEAWIAAGFAPIRARFLALSHSAGEPLTLGMSGKAPVSGRFIAIDETGCLCLDVDGEQRRFAAGDVYPGLNSQAEPL